MKPEREVLADGLAGLGLEPGTDLLDPLLAFLDLLEKWNGVYNLTAVRDRSSWVHLHLLDSLAVLHEVRGRQLLDVGTGAGFPGMPLAMARPALQVTLLDSNQKKTAFLRQAAAELGLGNVSVVSQRVEAFRPPRLFDTVTSRAFASVADFVTLSAHLLAPGGRFLAMKGTAPEAEIRALPTGFHVEQVLPLVVPGLEASRHLVIVEHEGATASANG